MFLLWMSVSLAGVQGPEPGKTQSVFYPAPLVEKAKANVQKYPWATAIQKSLVEAAQLWMKFSDEELWDLMFGHTITRSWMVWSNGHCPACQKDVPMYSWEVDAFQRPWKVRCPHCRELFPKNDFYQFYRSGLDEHGVFDPPRADRTLLFNVEHPDPQDPLRTFGVDDGEGYVEAPPSIPPARRGEGEKRWRFIGAYLIYGQWKQLILGGIHNLAAAYVVTGDRTYAHKAGVLLDRVADLYPTFDFEKEGLAYERGHGSGYVSTWHDACEETRELALAYDQVFEALRDDPELVAFLSRKARQFQLPNPKASFADVQRNLEEGILRDALKNRQKIYSNYPRTEVAVATLEAVLGWPGNREEVVAMLDPVIAKATAVDGVTGEKGLAAYSAYVIQGLALLLGQFARLEPDFLRDILQRHPRLHQTYRFHIDTWCFQQYYPQSGDTGSFAHRSEQYAGVSFSKNPGLAPSMYGFLWDLYGLTGDAAFVQVLYHANDDTVDGLPYDLLADDPAALQQGVREVIAREGPVPQVGSVDKQQWHLAILRSGQGPEERALWLDYDAGGGHSHADGMNLGLFARGLDLLPDFGYPPVQFGGWGSPRAVWYKMTAAHNSVVVDGQSQPAAAGQTTLWADGKLFRALRVSGPELIGGKQYERTVALVDVSERDSYVADVFRVVGGADHAKFLHSHFGPITSQGLSLQPAEDYGYDTQMRHFLRDPAPQPGWSVDWQIEDRYQYLPPGSDVHLRYTDLTANAQAFTAEAWIAVGGFGANPEVWIPCVMVRRQEQEGPLASTFVGVLEPYEGQSNLAYIRLLPLQTPEGVAYPEANVAVEVQFPDGSSDLFIAADAENPLGLSPSRAANGILVQPDWDMRLEGELGWIRRDAAGEVQHLALGRGNSVTVGDVSLRLKRSADFIEVSLVEGRATVVSGPPEDVEDVLVKGRSVWQGR